MRRDLVQFEKDKRKKAKIQDDGKECQKGTSYRNKNFTRPSKKQ